jgi:hypothetical protein
MYVKTWSRTKSTGFVGDVYNDSRTVQGFSIAWYRYRYLKKSSCTLARLCFQNYDLGTHNISWRLSNWIESHCSDIHLKVFQGGLFEARRKIAAARSRQVFVYSRYPRRLTLPLIEPRILSRQTFSSARSHLSLPNVRLDPQYRNYSLQSLPQGAIWKRISTLRIHTECN